VRPEEPVAAYPFIVKEDNAGEKEIERKFHEIKDLDESTNLQETIYIRNLNDE
jgi:hypothetical protein